MHYIGDLDSRRRRLQLWVRIYLMRWLAWTADWWQLATGGQQLDSQGTDGRPRPLAP